MASFWLGEDATWTTQPPGSTEEVLIWSTSTQSTFCDGTGSDGRGTEIAAAAAATGSAVSPVSANAATTSSPSGRNAGVGTSSTGRAPAGFLTGVGPALATALVASVVDAKAFRSGRNFSAWIGLVPKQHSSGGKDKLGSISKQGDRYLRSLFTAGALAVIRYAKINGTQHRPWLTALLARRPTKVAAIALANKIARMAWAMMAKDERYKEPVALMA